MQTHRGIVRQEVSGTWGKGYKETTAKAHIYSTHKDLPEETVLVVPGLGEEALTARKLVKLQQEAGRPVAVAVLRFPDQLSINFVCLHMPAIVAAQVNKRKGQPADAPIHTISHSQGGGLLLSSSPYTPQLQDARHAVVSPVGINTFHFGATQQERERTFWKRHLWQNMMQRAQFTDPKNWPTGLDLTKRLFLDMAGSLVTNGYNLLPHKIDYAFSEEMHQQTLLGLEHLSERAKVTIISGAEDPVFPASEIQETLEKYGLSSVPVIQTHGAHESMVGSLGRLQVDAAFAAISN